MNHNSKIFLAGHQGMVGKSIFNKLIDSGYKNILVRTKAELNLINQSEVIEFFLENKPEIVIIAAAKVGGINANNSSPAEFIYENLMIEANLIHNAHKAGVEKLLFLGSSCIYPKLARQPIIENELMNGKLESTNEPYAIAKIAGIKLCESYNRQYSRDFRSVMPTNLYGQFDNFHLTNGHVIPSLIHRFHLAKTRELSQVEVWGSGKPLREFLYVDDLADACIFIINLSKAEYQKNTAELVSHINIGSGDELSIGELVRIIKAVVGFQGEVVFNRDYPDGTPRKMIDSSNLIKLGWKPKINLKKGLHLTYEWFQENIDSMRK